MTNEELDHLAQLEAALTARCEAHYVTIKQRDQLLAACKTALKVVSEISDINGESRAGWCHKELAYAIEHTASIADLTNKTLQAYETVMAQRDALLIACKEGVVRVEKFGCYPRSEGIVLDCQATAEHMRRAIAFTEKGTR